MGAPTKVAITVDMVVQKQPSQKVLFIRRGNAPYKGMLALPGGFVDKDETIEAAALRELKEETGVTPKRRLEFTHFFDSPDRDPRGRTISFAFYVTVANNCKAVAGDDAAETVWMKPSDALAEGLAFDHADILQSFGFRAAPASEEQE